MWATQLAAAGHEVVVLTRESNRQAIEASRTGAVRTRLRFVYYDLPAWARKWKRRERWRRVYYWLWQWGAYRKAQQLVRAGLHFDFVQHVTFVSLRAPSFMGLLGIPFYFGPVSGGEEVPRRLLKGMSWRARLAEGVRSCANRLVRFDPLMRMTFRTAARIYLTSPDSVRLIPARYRKKCEVQFGVHLRREYLGWTGRHAPRYGPVSRLLYAGRFLEWKGLAIALEAVRILRDEGVPVEFTLIGDGPAEARLRQQASQLGIESHVRWKRWLSFAELQREYQAHHVFLFPSLRDSGGMALLEALAHGVPAVCADVGGPGQIVTETCGRVIRTQGKSRGEVIAGFAEALQELAQNRGLLDRLSIGARRRAWDFEFGPAIERVYPSPIPSAAGERAEQTAS